MLNRPFDRTAGRSHEIRQRPLPAPEGSDIADRAHRDFDQSCRVNERLRSGLRLDEALKHFLVRSLPVPGIRMRRDDAAHIIEAALLQHSLQVLAVAQAAWKAAGRAKTRRLDSETRTHRLRGEID